MIMTFMPAHSSMNRSSINRILTASGVLGDDLERLRDPLSVCTRIDALQARRSTRASTA